MRFEPNDELCGLKKGEGSVVSVDKCPFVNSSTQSALRFCVSKLAAYRFSRLG